MPSPLHPLVRRLEENIGSVILGKHSAIQLALVALLAEGHLLIEDAPGVGKTSLAKSLALSLGCRFTRLQFTPDMLPSDILGGSIFLPNRGEFEFRPGPVFTQVLLADEINRTPPRTQSALLEAMMEKQVSVEGRTHPLEKPFFVLATQNPYEFEGTYPLPENQLDRFMVCMEIGYPDKAAEKAVLISHRHGEPVNGLKPVITNEQLMELQAAVREVRIDDALHDYILEIVHATRSHPELTIGVSTRGAVTFSRAIQSQAFVAGRDYVIPDDVKAMAIPVLAHRVVCSGILREGQRKRAQAVLQQMLAKIPVPR
ncbi:MAG: MoxR family ATPase [Planctomycetota bacterium]|nr:MAG: MoxR family ATPase [Planctomycetota bacterium]